LNRSSLELVGHYLALNFLGLMAYGALCMFMGAYFRHPVVLGVVALFGWQRIATIVPGLVDFLTIEKYLTILLPKVAIQRENQMIKTALVEFQKKEFLISGTRALVTLLVITAVLLVLTSYVVRQREYSSARAVGS
jgi:hypothetical protein